ncbi:cytochrome c maturation protein CcmE [Pelagibacteraceae bacterium]|jgi:cytochrome c-type biogenesis protein CcmE|nr:cytochrome c maturation protein CcmE [Pelagibacteraceae bacterium]|tara:strand:+ start:33 stop:461 length:429 start_codon:yes stop_codon:yes gene_type:complete
MLAKKAKNRILIVTIALFLLATSLFFILETLNKNLLYFRTPSDIIENSSIKVGESMRLGGMVKKNSISTTKEEITFIITDLKNEIIVSYAGSVPNLFSEEKGVIAEGKLKDRKYFIASRILAKHDENYMPPELGEVIKKNVK